MAAPSTKHDEAATSNAPTPENPDPSSHTTTTVTTTVVTQQEHGSSGEHSATTNAPQPVLLLVCSASVQTDPVMFLDCDGGDEEELPYVPHFDAWHKLVAGGLAGAVSRTFTAPLDRVKVLAQEGRIVEYAHQLHHPTSHVLANAHARKVKLRKVVRHIYSEGGVVAFWRGNGINCLKAGPELALVFFLRQVLMDSIRPYTTDAANDTTTDSPASSSDASSAPPRRFLIPATAANFVTSAAAGAIAQCFLYPLETTKTRIAVSSPGEYKSLADCMKQSYLRGGMADFYKGLGANLMGIVPYRGLEVGCFYSLRQALQLRRAAQWQALKDSDGGGVYALHGPTHEQRHRREMLQCRKRRHMKRHPEEKDRQQQREDDPPEPLPVLPSRDDYCQLSVTDIAFVGTVSSVLAQTVTYPLNLVRTRLQTQGVNGRPKQYKGMFHCFTSIVQKDGPAGLFHGLSANYLKAVPASVITFVVVEQTCNMLSRWGQ